MSLGEKIQWLRKENFLTQEALAEKLGVSRQAISKWELNEALPDTNKLLSLSKLFKVSIDYLLNNEIEKSNEKGINPSNIKIENSDVSISKTNWYQEYKGKWVKIYFQDKGYGGVYKAGIIDMDDTYMLFIDDDGKLGILTIKNIKSIMDADIYRKKTIIPALNIPVYETKKLLSNFIGKTCEIHVVCKSHFASPGGFYRARIEDITSDSMLVLYNNQRSIINLSDLLIVFEK